MALFYIAINLGKRKDYRKLLQRLERLQARRVLRFVWVLEEEYTAERLRDDLSQCVAEDYRLMVIESANAAWSGPLLSDPRRL